MMTHVSMADIYTGVRQRYHMNLCVHNKQDWKGVLFGVHCHFKGFLNTSSWELTSAG
jgi:hypothetical protein